jgi:hypothetical protein
VKRYTSPSGNVIGVPGNFKQAYAEQFNFTVEQEMAPIKTLFKLAYVGNLGRRLGNAFNDKVAFDSTGFKPVVV